MTFDLKLPFIFAAFGLIVVSSFSMQMVAMQLDEEQKLRKKVWTDEEFEAIDEYGYTILHRAVYNKNEQQVKDILEDTRVANIINKQTSHTQETALHWAAHKESEPIFRLLIEKKADKEITDIRGHKALSNFINPDLRLKLENFSIKDIDSLSSDIQNECKTVETENKHVSQHCGTWKKFIFGTTATIGIGIISYFIKISFFDKNKQVKKKLNLFKLSRN